jgi:hypothetical protein
MTQDVINMPHVKQYKTTMKRILPFMSQMTLESRTIFTVRVNFYNDFKGVTWLKYSALVKPHSLNSWTILEIENPRISR